MANDPYWNSVVLAMHMDGTGLTDLKGHAVTLVGNAARSATQSKFGGYSAYFDGTGDYLSIPHSTDYDFGGGDFTIECFVFVISFSAARPIFTKWNSATANLASGAENSFMFNIASATSVAFAFRGTDGTTYNSVSFTVPALSTGVFYHLSLNRSGSSWKLFIDGVQQGGTQTNANVIARTGTQAQLIGRYFAGAASEFTGYIDDLRITKGVARYTENFPPPTAAFPDQMVQIAGTVRDASNAFAARTVRAYRRSDGALAGSATSNGTTGAFSISALDNTAHYAVCLDDGTPDENALIFDNITPV